MLAVLALGAAPAKADILFNDYGPADTYTSGVGWSVNSNFEQAFGFTPLVTEAVSSVDFGLSLGLPVGTNSVVIDLMTDNDGSPESVLERYTFVNQMAPFGSQNAPLSSTSVAHPVLVAGTHYWMVALPGASDTHAIWNNNNQGAIGPRTVTNDGGITWNNEGPSTLGAFEVFGSPTSPVPEPSSIALLGMGIAGLGIARWRKRKQAA